MSPQSCYQAGSTSSKGNLRTLSGGLKMPSDSKRKLAGPESRRSTPKLNVARRFSRVRSNAGLDHRVEMTDGTLLGLSGV